MLRDNQYTFTQTVTDTRIHKYTHKYTHTPHVHTNAHISTHTHTHARPHSRNSSYTDNLSITIRSHCYLLHFDAGTTSFRSSWVRQEMTTSRWHHLDHSSMSTTSQVLESWRPISIYSTATPRCTTSTSAGRVADSTSTTGNGVDCAPCCTPAPTECTSTGMKTSTSGGTRESVSIVLQRRATNCGCPGEQNR